ncbi:MAG: cytochrome c [candidate division Zixibacteria bacterium]|nr:cytochrome c [candidate division Zixibacteria bacterium]NIR62579.1 cytochrome c [candidate division Zixibacteria bacterium]NIS15342.1 cytochrome c [candidate division Zixibacteria bacterium]NIS44696.1 cytochrome c [candidate division Zixibacteria bacterium]NIT51867.1 cytochrome c [candidate division Zixibacteria bacterium]
MKILIVIIIILALAMGLFIIFINSGIYNIAATSEHNSLTLKIINTTVDNSIKRHAEGIEVPDLTDSNMIARGFEHFDEMCVICHGAIGIGKDEFAIGLYPEAPALEEEAEEWTAAELFWITKHGIKLTGMPAIGDVHSDREIWPIIAFLQVLPEMTYQEYISMRQTGEQESEEAEEENSQNHGSHTH